jgi:hypothetical protein
MVTENSKVCSMIELVVDRETAFYHKWEVVEQADSKVIKIRIIRDKEDINNQLMDSLCKTKMHQMITSMDTQLTHNNKILQPSKTKEILETPKLDLETNLEH